MLALNAYGAAYGAAYSDRSRNSYAPRGVLPGVLCDEQDSGLGRPGPGLCSVLLQFYLLVYFNSWNRADINKR